MTESSERVDALLHRQRRARRPASAARLHRPVAGRRLGGVCRGIADFVSGDVRLVRALWLVSVPLSLGVSLIAYALLWMLLPGPEGPSEDDADR